MKKLKTAAAMLLALVTLLAVPMSSLAASKTIDVTVGPATYRATLTAKPNLITNAFSTATLSVSLKNGKTQEFLAGYVTAVAFGSKGDLIGLQKKSFEKFGASSFVEKAIFFSTADPVYLASGYASLAGKTISVPVSSR